MSNARAIGADLVEIVFRMPGGQGIAACFTRAQWRKIERDVQEAFLHAAFAAQDRDAIADISRWESVT